MDEIWRVVKDAPNYEVSNLGHVRRKKSGRPLKPSGSGRRARVVLMSYGDRLSVVVEELVRNTFRRAFEPQTGERWRRVDCAWGYEVSDQGNVRVARTGRLLKTHPNNRTGRPQVTLVDDGYRLTRPVHVLVKDAFPD